MRTLPSTTTISASFVFFSCSADLILVVGLELMLRSNSLSFEVVRSPAFFLWAALPSGDVGPRLPEANDPLVGVEAFLSLQLPEVGPDDETVFSSCSTW